jgi:signal peptidase I
MKEEKNDNMVANQGTIPEDKADLKQKKFSLKELAVWAAVFAGAFFFAFLINSNVYATIKVDQSSMENTLFDSQRLVEDIISYKFHEPERGDIIIFYPNEEKGTISDDFQRYIENLKSSLDRNRAEEEEHERYIKRVIGIEGDVIDIKDGEVYLNGERLEEPYANGITTPKGCELPVTVGRNQLFVMGDNREVSIDSREIGLVNLNQIEGKAIFRIYPFNEFGKIE